MLLEQKAITAAGFKIEDPEQGIVSVIPSVSGRIDKVKDIIAPGAYQYGLAQGRRPKGVWSHDIHTPVARAIEVKELLPGDPLLPATLRNGEPWPADAGAYWVKAQFNLDTQAGRDAFANVKFFGDDQEWSIGYLIPEGGAKVDRKTGVRTIERIDVYEFSPVLFGAHPDTATLATAGEFKSLDRRTDEAGQKLHAMYPGALDVQVNMVRSEVYRTWPDVYDDRERPVTIYWVEAVMADEVIVRRHDYGDDGSESTYLAIPYTYDEDSGDVSFGEPTEVEIDIEVTVTRAVGDGGDEEVEASEPLSLGRVGRLNRPKDGLPSPTELADQVGSITDVVNALADVVNGIAETVERVASATLSAPAVEVEQPEAAATEAASPEATDDPTSGDDASQEADAPAEVAEAEASGTEAESVDPVEVEQAADATEAAADVDGPTLVAASEFLGVDELRALRQIARP